MDIPQIVDYFRHNDPQTLAQWFKDKVQIAQILDRRDGGTQPVLISYHRDEVRRVETGYGEGIKPEDYLEGFKAYLQENMNKIPALIVVTQRPKELTRSQLKQLAIELDKAGYQEKSLQVAWREIKSEDITANIIGFIRQAALGDALVPYNERVDKAIKKIIASGRWTPNQRKWLERIGKQLKIETIVDKEAIDGGQFREYGGFKQINQVFDGKLEKILEEINEGIWGEIS
ncbi:hypothetical protein C7H19_08635 [Aphanothece hegewaldii CCALA 016]|uniref:EcoEI R protein C-terminal domain-containing protein n=1 Tax=Aphanothece hegewaldii CCALA 016 TaxID=2107694 RepID=A0A2T1LYZ6_9CHRO|nr:type I restriction-modification enzyme R subunit C-terminal domain-containing protein [Aphanothece hegewaldii]PSF37613.1 hypothetical protein C7H19_08635 [Aphanothece hegewaldii CCALA 016]